MWSLPVVVFHPGRDLDPGMSHAQEQRLVEQFVPHATVEALDVAILHRPSGRDVMPLHADLAAPCQHRIAGEFGAVVADDHAGLATPFDQLGQPNDGGHLIRGCRWPARKFAKLSTRRGR